MNDSSTTVADQFWRVVPIALQRAREHEVSSTTVSMGGLTFSIKADASKLMAAFFSSTGASESCVDRITKLVAEHNIPVLAAVADDGKVYPVRFFPLADGKVEKIKSTGRYETQSTRFPFFS